MAARIDEGDPETITISVSVEGSTDTVPAVLKIKDDDEAGVILPANSLTAAAGESASMHR